MAGSQIPTSVTIIASLKGYQAISLNEYSTSAAASIAAGSVVEIAGAFFTFVSDETPDASTWTSLATGATGYIALTPSGTAGSQIVSVAYTATAPTWRDDFQGWYASAASTTRVIGTVYKIDTPSYYPKYLYGSMQDGKQSAINVNSASVASTLSAQNASVASTLSAQNASVASTFSVGGYAGYAYKTTTESVVKLSLGSYATTTFTTVSSVRAVCHAIANTSGTPYSWDAVNATCTTGVITMAGTVTAGASPTHQTFIITYLY
jgi:hypothetical protein